MNWNPGQYLKFSDHRLRPALDLLARIPDSDPQEVYDLGCGAGTVTVFLKERWPKARIEGLDSSPEMLASAKERLPGVTWRLADIGAWRPSLPASVVYSNAALQWLDDHPKLFTHLFGQVAPGGTLAVQMPSNFDRPSHLLLGETVDEGPWRAKLNPHLRRKPVGRSAEYWRLFPGAATEIWETEYLQPLSGAQAVLQWMMGTTLRPILARLELGAEQDDFLAAFGAKLDTAYPPEANGITLFPFRRLFIVARAK